MKKKEDVMSKKKKEDAPQKPPVEMLGIIEVGVDEMKSGQHFGFPGTVVGITEKQNGNMIFAFRAGPDYVEIVRRQKEKMTEIRDMMLQLPTTLRFADPISAQVLENWTNKMCQLMEIGRTKKPSIIV